MFKINNKKITRIGITTALTCVIAPMTIPTQPVPFTMATFMLWVVSMVLPPDEAFYSISLFVLLGAFGLPVFSNYTGGFQKIVGVTAGYIWAFPSTPLFFMLGKKIFKNKYLIRAFGVFVSFAFICLLGMFWMWVWGTKLQEIPIEKFGSLWSLLKIGYLPFLGSMAIKGVLASIVADKIKIS